MQLSRLVPYSAPRLFPGWRDGTGSLTIPRWLRQPRHFPLLTFISTLIVLALLVPVAYLGLRVVEGGRDSVEYLLRARTLGIIANSLLLVVSVTLSAAAVGTAFAWLTARTDLPFRRVWLVLGLLPMVIPSYLGAAALLAAFGPRGLLRDVLAPFGVDALPSIYGFFGAWLAITLFTYPYVALPVRAALLNADPALEEAARGLGLNRWRVFRQVTLPQIRPALAAGMLLTALYTLSEFGAVSMMRFNTFTRAIDLSYRASFNREQAAVLAFALIALTLPLLALERRMTAQTRNYRVGTGVRRLCVPIALGHWRSAALAFCGGLIGLGVIVPVGVMFMWLVTRAPVETMPVHFGSLVGSTVGVSLTAAVVMAVLALPLGLIGTRKPTRFGRLLVGTSYLGNALPGIVIGLALVYFAANHLPAFYQTFPLLIMGYTLRFLPLSVGATQSALTQINPCLEEAARGLGCRPWQVAVRITAPLARAGLLAGMALVFLNVMKELPTTLMLSPIGFRTLATRIWTGYSDGLYALLAKPGLLLMGVSVLALVIILWRDQQTTR
ncbi:MAG: iron ABC transporter permease [bacterium]|nr:iron ABC transporter permease [bacterium]